MPTRNNTFSEKSEALTCGAWAQWVNGTTHRGGSPSPGKGGLNGRLARTGAFVPSGKSVEMDCFVFVCLFVCSKFSKFSDRTLISSRNSSYVIL